MQKPSDDLPHPNWIDINDFEFICFNFAKQQLEFDEPIPDYSTRNNALLESALATPRNAYELSSANLATQAAVLFYSLIKNHPFQNGNKRIAVMSLLVFLLINEKWITIPRDMLYEITVIVAQSESKERDLIMTNNEKLFEKYIKDADF